MPPAERDMSGKIFRIVIHQDVRAFLRMLVHRESASDMNLALYWDVRPNWIGSELRQVVGNGVGGAV